MAVIGLRWHYPSDALAGAAFGVGVVLLVDGVLHLVAPDLRARPGPCRSWPVPGVVTGSDSAAHPPAILKDDEDPFAIRSGTELVW